MTALTPAFYANAYAVLLGFGIAGVLASGYQVLANRPLSFRLLAAERLLALLSIPLLTFGAPFLIMRNTVRGRRIENRRFEAAMLATMLACFWSLMSGTVIVNMIGRVIG